jgi:hypothetical protein
MSASDLIGYQTARDDEENVDADETGWQQGRRKVEDEDSKNSNGAQAFHVSSEVASFRKLGNATRSPMDHSALSCLTGRRAQKRWMSDSARLRRALIQVPS